MSAPGTALLKVCAWVAMALVMVVPAIPMAEEQAVEISLANEELIQQVCVGPYEIEVISVDPEIDEYYSARPLTFGERWAWTNKVLFGKKQDSTLAKEVAFAYEPELFWTIWQKNYFEDKDSTHIIDSGETEEKRSVGAPVAIVEYAGEGKWWQPKKYMGKYISIVESDAGQAKSPEESQHTWDESADIAIQPALTIMQNELKKSWNYEVEAQELLGWLETYCALGSLSYNQGFIGLSKAYEEVEPYEVFVLDKRAETENDKAKN